MTVTLQIAAAHRLGRIAALAGAGEAAREQEDQREQHDDAGEEDRAACTRASAPARRGSPRASSLSGCGVRIGAGRVGHLVVPMSGRGSWVPAAAERAVELDEGERFVGPAGGEAVARGERLRSTSSSWSKSGQARAILDAGEDRAVVGRVQRDREFRLPRAARRSARPAHSRHPRARSAPTGDRWRARPRPPPAASGAASAAGRRRTGSGSRPPRDAAGDRVEQAAEREGRGADIPAEPQRRIELRLGDADPGGGGGERALGGRARPAAGAAYRRGCRRRRRAGPRGTGFDLPQLAVSAPGARPVSTAIR